jgi:hypothetical protein
MQCRKYFSVDDPAKCGTVTEIKQMVNLEMEIIFSYMAFKFKTFGSLPTMLLNAME